jgi:hypothetical protein
MNHSSANGRSAQLVEMEAPEPLGVSSMAQKSTFELIDSNELARRLSLPASWVRSHTRARTLDEIPCIRFGKYVRFRWGSPELERWIAAHEGGHG